MWMGVCVSVCVWMDVVVGAKRHDAPVNVSRRAATNRAGPFKSYGPRRSLGASLGGVVLPPRETPTICCSLTHTLASSSSVLLLAVISGAHSSGTYIYMYKYIYIV